MVSLPLQKDSHMACHILAYAKGKTKKTSNPSEIHQDAQRIRSEKKSPLGKKYVYPSKLALSYRK